MKDPDFIYIQYIGATPDKVWEALTTNDFLSKYWTGPIETDWKTGSPLTMHFLDGKVDWDGKILECVPPKKLSYTFRIHGYQEESSRVVFELEPAGRKATKLTLSHYDIEAKCRKGIAEGWSSLLSGMKTLVETGNLLDRSA